MTDAGEGAPGSAKRRWVSYNRAFDLVSHELATSKEGERMSDKRVRQEADLRARIIVANSKCECGRCRDVLGMGWSAWYAYYMSLLFSASGVEAHTCLCEEPVLNRNRVFATLDV